MNYTILSNFINNTENIISNTIGNKDFTTIKTEEQCCYYVRVTI